MAIIRAYKPQCGDIFTIEAKNFKYHPKEQFKIVHKYKVVKWYNPLIWFKVYYKIMYIGENNYGKEKYECSSNGKSKEI